MVEKSPLQGDIIKLNLNPKKGHEQQGFRPYICLSNRIISDTSHIVVCAPISNTKRNYPLYIKLSDCKTTGSVLLDQIVAIDAAYRGFEYVESVSDSLLEELLSKVVLIFQKNKN